ncbi:MAG: PfkB family carbohydrate kinase [Cyanobacteriota bacterium]
MPHSEPLHPLALNQLPPLTALRMAVVGHVEVVSFISVDALPQPGTIVHARSAHEAPAGGGAVVAVQMARLVGSGVPFFTALGDDALGHQAARTLTALGLELHVAWRQAPTRRAVTFIETSGERTITVIGERLTPLASDPLPWHRLQDMDGVFVTAADAKALRLARAARVLAATPRVRLPVLQEAAVPLDALIGSGLDPGERTSVGDLNPEPRLRIATEGSRGGLRIPGGRFLAPQRHGAVIDTYGAGDSFAAGVTCGLAADWSVEEAISLGCHCGAACLDGAGPYGAQLSLVP